MSDWDFYQANINEKIASIYLDLEADKELSQESSILYWFFIKLKIYRADGLSHDDEYESLIEYEDKLLSFICSESLHFVGRITTDGMRQFYFYGTRNVSFIELCNEFSSKNADYLCQFNSKPDPSRQHFQNVLYPGKYGLEQIQKRRDNA